MVNENYWICHSCSMHNDNSFVNCQVCFEQKLTIHFVIEKIILIGETYYETLSPNLDPSLRAKADLLVSLLQHEKFGSYLEEKFMNNEISTDYLNEILSDFVVSDDIINFLMRQCAICFECFPLSNINNMTSCNCEFCNSCLKEWLKENIYSKPTNNWYCPSCPNRMTKIDKNLHFLSFKNIIDSDETLRDLFYDKLLDEELGSSKKFRRCPNEQCLNGFEIMSEKEPMVECTKCESFMCINCNVKWHKEETCEQYQLRTLNNDSNLMELMKEIGIKCPKCRVLYDHTKGGCLHLKCTNCRLEFCSCCKEVFRKGKCLHSNCINTGFHAHHPRNCSYFTRDYDINNLCSALKNMNLQIPKKLNVKMCPTILTDKCFKDSKCNKPCYKNFGLCREHSKDYLCLLIFKNNIDVSSISERFNN